MYPGWISAATAVALIGLHATGRTADDPVVGRAVEWLLKQLPATAATLSPLLAYPACENGFGGFGHVSRHECLLSAGLERRLAIAKIGIVSVFVRKGVDFPLDAPHNGRKPLNLAKDT